jgi:hypothetical protein
LQQRQQHAQHRARSARGVVQQSQTAAGKSAAESATDTAAELAAAAAAAAALKQQLAAIREQLRRERLLVSRQLNKVLPDAVPKRTVVCSKSLPRVLAALGNVADGALKKEAKTAATAAADAVRQFDSLVKSGAPAELLTDTTGLVTALAAHCSRLTVAVDAYVQKMVREVLKKDSRQARATAAKKREQAERERAAREQLDRGLIAADPYGSDFDLVEDELQAEYYRAEREDQDRVVARNKLDHMFGRSLSCGGLAAPLSKQAMYG